MLATYTTLAELPPPMHRPAYSAFQCSECGAVKMLSAPGHCGAAGYAIVDTTPDRPTSSGRLACYSCADAAARGRMRNHKGPFGAYLSSDGRTVTTWTGGTLGTVFDLTSSRSGFHGSRVYRWRVLDTHGQWWQGRGAGQSMACTLRPMQPPPGA